jgi:acyl carrier protein
MADAAPSGARRSSDSNADRVRAIVARTSGRQAITDDCDLARDLQLDADDRAELLMAVELVFHIDFSPSEAESVSTVAELIEIVGRKARMAVPERSDREALLEAIDDLAVGAASAGEPIDLVAAAISLAEDHPRSGLTMEGIFDAIERAAAAAGAEIIAGDRRSA